MESGDIFGQNFTKTKMKQRHGNAFRIGLLQVDNNHENLTTCAQEHGRAALPVRSRDSVPLHTLTAHFSKRGNVSERAARASGGRDVRGVRDVRDGRATCAAPCS
ncbi:hypothetical protein RR46_15285 [Papilio xuthus]|uniref:Uncharacterized protein n=1 Tax=Papilio xuthus TaxID=66420 RepID=A0A194PEJ8_PAPXU|nr:hypothetical protein RR46_15285 [Papilio xuthus]